MQFNKPLFWDSKKISLWSILLFPISIIFIMLTKFVKTYQNFKTFKKPSIPIICVGNIYLGGTGKTPLAREIFNITKTLGKNPAFIKKYHKYLSDEIEMLKATGETFVGNKRDECIFSSILKNHDVAIMDDGFQDFSIKSDLSILCFNSRQMIGNGFVIPSGPLRERLNAIHRADCIVINGEKNLELEKKILKNVGKKQLHIFYSKYKIKNIEKFKDRQLIAFAGIGNPSNFFDLLKEHNLNIKKTYSFPDHYKYNDNDFEKLKYDNSTKIITTEKDYFRMSKTQKNKCDYVEVDLKIDNINEFKKIIKNYL
ncbi:tetraacyldisaccharide 4'-kinase [Candidatus Pelagibacter communis]|uniref:tetraacyldisaccharide 4'-kinase n=1 Tax=Pelagibacter ubique TaxID=198252 RepID=UPI00094C2AB3|nr:tetraacyldisaccharide 4'-kinase [Candidatus Pelagibacter ubique]|tara:strand:+ start:3152 stop:4087 length:936 start_codon:yes stop_codon:yes gene_type:complete